MADLGRVHGDEHPDEGPLHNVCFPCKGALQGPLSHVFNNNGRGANHAGPTSLGLAS